MEGAVSTNADARMVQGTFQISFKSISIYQKIFHLRQMCYLTIFSSY